VSIALTLVQSGVGEGEGGAPEAHVPCYVADGTGLNEI